MKNKIIFISKEKSIEACWKKIQKRSLVENITDHFFFDEFRFAYPRDILIEKSKDEVVFRLKDKDEGLFLEYSDFIFLKESIQQKIKQNRYDVFYGEFYNFIKPETDIDIVKNEIILNLSLLLDIDKTMLDFSESSVKVLLDKLAQYANSFFLTYNVKQLLICYLLIYLIESSSKSMEVKLIYSSIIPLEGVVEAPYNIGYCVKREKFNTSDFSLAGIILDSFTQSILFNPVPIEKYLAFHLGKL